MGMLKLISSLNIKIKRSSGQEHKPSSPTPSSLTSCLTLLQLKYCLSLKPRKSLSIANQINR